MSLGARENLLSVDLTDGAPHPVSEGVGSGRNIVGCALPPVTGRADSIGVTISTSRTTPQIVTKVLGWQP